MFKAFLCWGKKGNNYPIPLFANWNYKGKNPTFFVQVFCVFSFTILTILALLVDTKDQVIQPL